MKKDPLLTYLIILTVIVSVINGYLFLSCKKEVCRCVDGPTYTELIDVLYGRINIKEMSHWGRIKIVMLSL